MLIANRTYCSVCQVSVAQHPVCVLFRKRIFLFSDQIAKKKQSIVVIMDNKRSQTAITTW